jgi:hypothetical protein
MRNALIEADAPASLSPRHEDFALHVAAGCSYLDAYMQAYAADDSGATRVSACRLAKRPDVVARVREIRTVAATKAELSIAERMAWLDAIVHAPPLSRIVGAPCRHCWGYQGRYQWRDEAELQAAVTKAAKVMQPMPDPLGGFGFRPDAPANASCAHCGGKLTRVDVVPHEEMSAAQLALFKGVECNADGSIKRVLTHDQIAAADILNKMQSVYVQRTESKNLNVSMSAAEATELAAKPADEIVRILWKNKRSAPA